MNFKLNTDMYVCMSGGTPRGIESHVQHNITPSMHMNIDPRSSKGKG